MKLSLKAKLLFGLLLPPFCLLAQVNQAPSADIQGALQGSLIDSSVMASVSGTAVQVTQSVVVQKRNEIHEIAVRQQIQIRGKVTDSTGQPLAGTSVVIKGTNKGAVADEKGIFSIDAASGDILQFNHVGYVVKEVEIGAQHVINVFLTSQSNAINDVVVVGYGTQKKATLTGSVATVKMDDVLKDRPVTSVAQALQGAVPGLQITYGSGQPGTGASINIRGYTSIKGGGNPLVVVDNVPMDMADINPNDIESVSVLKDASAAAIYGGRAAFGVILITTKQGKRNQKTRFEYSDNMAISKASTLPQKVTTMQYVKALNDFGTTSAWTGQDIKTWLDLLNQYQSDPSQFPGGVATDNGVNYPLTQTNLYGDFFVQGFEQTHNLSFSGGTEKTNYRTSLAYTNQNGIVTGNNDTYKRYNFNTSLNTELTKTLTASVSVFYDNLRTTTPNNYGSVFNNLTKFAPYVKTGYGVLPGTTDTLPYSTPDNLVRMEAPVVSTPNNLRLFGKLEFTPIKNLKIVGEYTFTQENTDSVTVNNSDQYVNPQTYQLDVSNATSSYTKATSSTDINSLNLYASYNLNIANAHNFTFLVGTNQEKFSMSGYNAERLDLISSTVPSLSTSTGTITATDNFGEYALSGYFYRFNYAYKNRYLLEATGRYDGSSRFPQGHRYGFFPGASAGWVLTEEPLLQGLKKVFQQVKLRASYGEIGNQNTSSYYPYIAGMNPQYANWIDPSSALRYTTLNPPLLVSSSFSWESIRTYDAGIDLSLLKNRLSATFDIYREETLNMLVTGSSLSAVVGAAPPLENRADLRVDGLDLNLSWKDNITPDFSYSIGVNLTYKKPALVTKYNNPSKLLSDYYVGEHINEIWGYTTQGYFTADDFVAGALDANLLNTRTVTANNGLKPGIAGFQGVYQNPGDIRFVDRNGDSIISPGANTVFDPGDRSVIGNSTRQILYGITGSLNYKNFDFSFFINGVGKRDVWISNYVYWPYQDQFATLYEHQLNYWTPDNPNGFYPRMYADASGNTATSRSQQTKYLSNGAYLRVQSLGAGYTLPHRWISKLHIDKARIFFSGENLFTFDHLPAGLDPEATNLGNGAIYPFLKKYSFGINIGF